MRATNIAIKILIYGGLSVLLLWAMYGYLDLGLDREAWGQVGDKFGALNTLFTGLAFVGLVAAFWHEREQANGRDAEHTELLKVMTAQARSSYEATAFQAKLFRVSRLNQRLGEIRYNGAMTYPDERKNLEAELHRLQGELDRYSDTIPDWLRQ